MPHRCIVIAPLGNLRQYKRVSYRVVVAPNSLSNTIQQNCSSFAIAEALLSSGYCDDAVILAVVPDSAAGLLGVNPGNFSDYSSLVDAVHTAAVSLMQRWGVPRRARLVVTVAPNIGVFPQANFQARLHASLTTKVTPIDLYDTWLLAAALNAALQLKGDVSIVVDLTHGPNFMSSEARRVGELLAGALSVARLTPVGFRVYCSEPHVSDHVGTLTIHLYEDEILEPSVAARRLVSCLARWSATPQPLVAHTSRPHTQLMGRKVSIGHAAGIIASCAPLAAAYAADMAASGKANLPLLHDYAKLLDQLLRDLKNHAAVCTSSCSSVEWIAAPRWSTISAAAAESALLTSILGAYEEVLRKLGWLHKLGRYPSYYTLEELRELVERLPCYEPAKSIARNELDSIEQGYLQANPRVKRSIDVSAGCVFPGMPCNPSAVNDRNLYAHSGLEKNAIEAVRCCNTIALRYRGCRSGSNRCCYDVVVDKLRSALLT